VRPFRDQAARNDARRTELVPDRHTDFVVLDGQAVARRSAELGGTISDLLAASVINAFDGADEVSLRFPVSKRPVSGDRPRNQVSDMAVHGTASDGLPALMRSIRSQIEHRQLTSAPTPAGHQIGYVTLLPWTSAPRYFCGALITTLVPFAAGLGQDEITAAAVLYNGRLSVGATMQTDRDVTSIIQRVGRLMTGADSEVVGSERSA
jgi:hypothetical protein